MRAGYMQQLKEDPLLATFLAETGVAWATQVTHAPLASGAQLHDVAIMCKRRLFHCIQQSAVQDPVEFLFSRVRAATQHRAPCVLEATRTIGRDSAHVLVSGMLATSASNHDAGNRLNIGDSWMQYMVPTHPRGEEYAGLHRQVRKQKGVQPDRGCP